ncbi:MAG: hypothetical protein AB7Y46_03410 [Armatimonadota bacterium]
MLSRLARALERLFASEGEGPPVAARRAFCITVRCARCGEVIRLRIDRDHELQSVYAPEAEEGDAPLEYILRKEVVGESCQNLIHFTIHFGPDHELVSSEIEGGEFLAEEPVPTHKPREEHPEQRT